MSGHSRAFNLGMPQKGVSFDGKFLTFSSGIPQNNISGFGKGALAIDKASGILYINQGNSTFANWTKVQGGSYMSDIVGVAPVMYEQKARVLVIGDSIHNTTQSIPSGYAPLTNWYHKQWRPNKWCGQYSILNSGGPQGGFQNENGSACFDIAVAMGSDNNLIGSAKYNIIQPCTFVNNFTSPPDGSNQIYAPGRFVGQLNPASATENNEEGVSTDYYFSWKEPDLSGFSVGRGQIFDNGGVENSQRWYNAPGAVLTNKTLWYRDTGGGWGTNLNGRASGFNSASGVSTDSFTLSGNWTATSLSTNAQSIDNMTTAAFWEYNAANGTSQTDKFLPVFSFVENEAITDGMVLGYHGSGGVSWASHGILDNGSGQPVEQPHETDGGEGWTTDAAIQELLKIFKPNVIYYSIYNNSEDDDYNEETYLQRAIQRMRANIDATSGVTGNDSNDVKIVVVTNYGNGTASQSPIWEERAYRVLDLAKANGYSTIDMYHKLRDNNIVPTGGGAIPPGWLHDNNHPNPHLSKIFADFVWEEIANTALTGN
jgi:hypothetical protein